MTLNQRRRCTPQCGNEKHMGSLKAACWWSCVDPLVVADFGGLRVVKWFPFVRFLSGSLWSIPIYNLFWGSGEKEKEEIVNLSAQDHRWSCYQHVSGTRRRKRALQPELFIGYMALPATNVKCHQSRQNNKDEVQIADTSLPWRCVDVACTQIKHVFRVTWNAK